MSEIEVYVRKNVCAVCRGSVYYSRYTEQILCDCGKRKQRYDQDFEAALEQLWTPSKIKSETLN